MTLDATLPADADDAAVPLGRWRVTDSANPQVPKKTTVELVAGAAALRIDLSDGGTVDVPYPKAFVRVDGVKKAKLHTDRGEVWLEGQEATTAAEFRAVVEQRHPAPYVAPVRASQDDLPINWVGVVIGLVVGLGALGLSIGSYTSASEVGGPYVVLWGAVLGGGYIVLKSLRFM